MVLINAKNNDNAVSPVIGTILLVMITVVLVAIVAIAVMGMAGNQSGYVVGVTVGAADSGNDAVVTLYSSKNLPELVKVEVIDAGSSLGEFVEVWNGTAGSAPVGVPFTAKKVARPAEEMQSYSTELSVRGTFADGTEQVLLMQDVIFSGVEEVVEGPTIAFDNKVEWGYQYSIEPEQGSQVPVSQGTLLDFGNGEYVYVKDTGAGYWKGNVEAGYKRSQFMNTVGSGGAFIPVDITPEKIQSEQSLNSATTSITTSDPIGTVYRDGKGTLYMMISPANWGTNRVIKIGSITP
ncbi:type IV pilin N-terminal domain-containing protein [Methanorbis rubei]|uniref:Archaeal Type IV pilin N-terminal domain-containing protein n=1 Tax=Methanorbis rubei TaxID=3028300 RepID=A0AAE4MFZ7_9EURY|nr:hypothetical protein [Methanocorpusculaceae archaeon Cs1]